MTKEEKDLLLKDLCARLPYEVIVKDRNGTHKLTAGNTEFTDLLYNGKCNIKPYLFPLSSMTEEHRNAFLESMRPALVDAISEETELEDEVTLISVKPDIICVDWLNAHHFDYRGLVEKGLAIDATGLNIYKKE